MIKYSHSIPIEHDFPPGALWPWKHTAEELAEMEKSDPYNYAAQMDQAPNKKGGSTFKTEWWKYYTIPPEYEWKAIFADTALKDGEENDYTVFQCWGKYQGRIYLIDQYRNKVKATELKQLFIDFWNKHTGSVVQPLRAAYIEDKASGTQLIQEIQKSGNIPVIPIPRWKSKVERANNLVHWIESGLLVLPENEEYLYDYKIEFERFTPLMTHKNDDQIDPTLDAIENMLIKDNIIKPKENDEQTKSIAPRKNDKIW